MQSRLRPLGKKWVLGHGSGWAWICPTQAKRRLEWGTLLFWGDWMSKLKPIFSRGLLWVGFSSFPSNKRRVPHISHFLGEMWGRPLVAPLHPQRGALTSNGPLAAVTLRRKRFEPGKRRPTAASHISPEEGEIWGTRLLFEGKEEKWLKIYGRKVRNKRIKLLFW
jgi:hypothetical protein